MELTYAVLGIGMLVILCNIIPLYIGWELNKLDGVKTVLLSYAITVIVVTWIIIAVYFIYLAGLLG